MAQDRIQFSIVTVSLNSGRKLIDTHDSIASQGVDYEHIIMDGGSTDGSRELGEKLAAADKRVRFNSEPDDGVYDAMNRALEKAAGKYLYFIGAGDVMLPGALLEISRHLPDNLASFVYGDCVMESAGHRGEFRKTDLASTNICHQGIFYGRELFRICGQFNCKYPALADWEFNMRCFGNRRIRKMYVPVVIAAFEPGGISGRGDTVFRADLEGLIKRHLGLFTYYCVTLTPVYNRHRQRLGRFLRRIKR